MKIFVFALALLCTFRQGLSVDVRLLDLEPTDAQQYIDKQDTTLKYAPKIESSVPAVRYLGNEPHHVLEDIYLANQYHGQDGLGGYLYGYSVPDIAKTEKKKAGGDLTGAYNYIAGNGQEIKVQYWDDGTGFHQVDNVPKILPKQIEDTPEVKAAKEEHARIWQEQAERNSRPIANPYANYGQNEQYQQPQQYQPKPQQPQQYQPQPQQTQQYQQYQQPQPSHPAQAHQYYEEQQTQSVSQYTKPSSGQYSESQQNYGGAVKQHNEEGEEENGPPRGFFYNFDYPVGIIVQKEGAVQKREGDLKDIYATNKALFEQQLHDPSSRPARSSTGYLVVKN